MHASHLILRRKVNLTGTRLLPCALLLQGTMCFRGRRATTISQCAAHKHRRPLQHVAASRGLLSKADL